MQALPCALLKSVGAELGHYNAQDGAASIFTVEWLPYKVPDISKPEKAAFKIPSFKEIMRSSIIVAQDKRMFPVADRTDPLFPNGLLATVNPPPPSTQEKSTFSRPLGVPNQHPFDTMCHKHLPSS